MTEDYVDLTTTGKELMAVDTGEEDRKRPRDMSEYNTPKSIWYEWTIPQFSFIGTKLESPLIESAGYKWKLVLKTNDSQRPGVSLYLASADTEPKCLSRMVRVRFIAFGSKSSHMIQRDFSHTFTMLNEDFGYGPLISELELHDASLGYLAQDTLHLGVYIYCPHPYGNMEPPAHDTPLPLGLENQGATCYMNSLLQSLYFTMDLRRAVYRMPTESISDASSSMPLALQLLFLRLQCDTVAVDTRELTQSFGWNTMDAFTQHDVQELDRVLCDKLEEAMKKTKVEGEIARLFEGKLFNYIKCLHVDYESTRKEAFYDLSLNVKGCNNILKSFEQYIESETMEGENKYAAEGFGLQDAKKGCYFLELPPVLHLQLKRFEYDPMYDAMVKLNDRYEFYDEISLAPYMDPSSSSQSNAQDDHTYVLHSVLVHAGSLDRGHYYAFIKLWNSDLTHTSWFKFDDETVTPATASEVLEGNFGGVDENPYCPPFMHSSSAYRKRAGGLARSASAYMLVYVRKKDLSSIMAPISTLDLPSHLKTKFDDEQKEKSKRLRELQEAHLHLSLNILTRQTLLDHTDRLLPSFHEEGGLQVLKDSSLASNRNLLSQHSSIPADALWIFEMEHRRNGAVRFVGPVLEDVEESQFLYKHGTHMYYIDDRRCYPEKEDWPNRALPDGTRFITLKIFNMTTQALKCLGPCLVPHEETKDAFCKRMIHLYSNQLEPNTSILLFEECENGEAVSIVNDEDFALIATGDIVILQQSTFGPEETAQRGVEAYLHALSLQISLQFQPLDVTSTIAPKTLDLTLDMTFDQVAEALGKAIQVDPLYLALHRRFTSTRFDAFTRDMTLYDMTRVMGEEVIYFSILDYAITDLETHVLISITIAQPQYQYETMELLVSKQGTVQDLIGLVTEKLETMDPYVLLLVDHHVIQKNLDISTPIVDLPDGFLNLIEPEPTLNEKEVLIQVVHKTRIASHMYHGMPFLLVVKENETVFSIRQRIQQRMHMNDKKFNKWDLYAEEVKLEGEMVLSETVTLQQGLELVLIHPDTSSARFARMNPSGAIRIG